jgi:multidrug efflux pump subunit AcrB
VTDSLTVPALQARYEMDESRLSRDGLSVADVADTVLAGLHGNIPTYFREEGREIPVRVRLMEEDRNNPMALSSLVLTPPDERVGHPLGEYGRLDLVPGPTAIQRRDQSRAVLVSVFLEGRRVGDILPEVQKVMAPFASQKDLTVQLAGEVREAKASFQSLMFGFAASVVLVYLVLVAQFNLLWVPLLAMVSVPLSVIGVAIGLPLTGNSLNLMSGQGLMILAGIVVNNSLMLLEFIQQKRAAGLAAEDRCSSVRPRPCAPDLYDGDRHRGGPPPSRARHRKRRRTPSPHGHHRDLRAIGFDCPHPRRDPPVIPRSPPFCQRIREGIPLSI